MSTSNWKEKELEHLSGLWDKRPKCPDRHTREMWNKRAIDWEQELRENKKRAARSERRVAATAGYLIERGVLTPETTVIDIGCGPGRFVAEFAKTAKHSSGLDISDTMTDYGLAYCREQGVSNVSFYAKDFETMDVLAEGMKERYDLVFTSLTPAIGNKAGYEKALEMTNGWFFNSNFISITDTLYETLENILNEHPVRSRDGAGFYCMLNELILKGYYPELTYYRESDVDVFDVDSAVEEYLAWFYREEPTGTQRESMKKAVESLADPDGKVVSNKEWIYVWVLADKQNRNVNDR